MPEDNVIELDSYREIWIAGVVFCMVCGHKHEALIRDDTNDSFLECPKCGYFWSSFIPFEEE